MDLVPNLTPYTKSTQMDERSKCKSPNPRLLEESTGVNIDYLGFGNRFIEVRTTNTSHKRKK